MSVVFQRSMKVVLTPLLILCSNAWANQILINGSFETGSLSGWTETNTKQVGGDGDWFASNTSTSPDYGYPTAGPASGAWYAVTDTRFPGSTALTQSFTVAAGSRVTFSFDMFVNAYADSIATPPSLDFHYTPGPPNEQGRVDLLTNGAAPFDVGAGVLLNFYDGVDALDNTNPYKHYSFDISSTVAAGGTYQIRFAAAYNLGVLNMGIDNVIVDASSVPEPGTVGLAAIGVIGIVAGISGRRRNS